MEIMAYKEQVKKKRNFSDQQYREFASKVGKKIAFSRKMNMLARHYQVSIYKLGPAVERAFMEGGPDDPVVLIREYHQLNDWKDLVGSKQSVIADHIRPTTWKSFCRFGDRNCATPSLKRNYINEDGTPLDVQALNMSTNFTEVTTDDLVAFMVDFPEGPQAYSASIQQEHERLSDRMRALVGFPLSYDFVHDFFDTFFRPLNPSDNTEVPF